MEAHERMGEKRIETGEITRDGREANQAISAILGDLILKGDTNMKADKIIKREVCLPPHVCIDNSISLYYIINKLDLLFSIPAPVGRKRQSIGLVQKCRLFRGRFF